MPSLIISIKSGSAIPIWNKFLSSLPFPVPFSFNPSLFVFYKKHFYWKPYYFLLFTGNRLVALLPMVFTGRAWVSIPHFSYGGILSKEGTLLQEQTALFRQIVNILRKMKPLPGFFRFDLENLPLSIEKTEKIFVRGLNSGDNNLLQPQKVSSFMALKPDEAWMWERLNANLRRKIGKSIKTGMVWKTGGEELIDDFYRVYTRNICHLGSIAYGKRFFSDLSESYVYGALRFFVVYMEGRPVGSALLAAYQGFYENLFFATLPPFRKYYLSDGLHWQMIKFSIEDYNNLFPERKVPGIYSFGRSTIRSSVHRYKNHWPVKDVPLHYLSDLRDVRNNSLLSSISGFLPCFATQFVGPYFIRHIY